MTIYKLLFLPSARKEWDKLGATTRSQFSKQLARRIVEPHVISSRLRSMDGCYKIKLRDAGYRLVYQVEDDRLIVTVVAVGKRERGTVYDDAFARLN
ncbi:MAG: type II toxin-antitoxin system RelE/ParE family toxin [Sphingomicrobium sp.]